MVAARAVFSMTGSILHAPQMFSLSSRPLYGMSALLFLVGRIGLRQVRPLDEV